MKDDLSSNEPLPRKTRIYAEPWEKRHRLAELGLTPEGLIEAVKRGLVSCVSCTANHPKSYPGILLWGETVGALREQRSLDGWTRSDESNQPVTIDPTRQWGITVATGTKETGRASGPDPVTQSPKGPQTTKAVRDNRQRCFDFHQEGRRGFVQVFAGCDRWILLVHFDEASREVRSELSRPINITEKGFVDQWSERILLPPIEIDGDAIARIDGTPETAGSPAIDFEVKRRAGSE